MTARKAAKSAPLVQEHCVRRIGKENSGVTYCGRSVDLYDQSEWTFSDPNHAIISGSNGTLLDGHRLAACSKCRKVILDLMARTATLKPKQEDKK